MRVEWVNKRQVLATTPVPEALLSWLCFPQNRVLPLAKGLFWEPDTPGPLPVLPPGPGKGLDPQGPLPTCCLIASVPQSTHPETFPPPANALHPQAPWVRPVAWALPSPWDRPLPQPHSAPDPWDPGLTAQDLLFRGSPKFRRQPRPVLDVTEQVSGPTREWTVLCGWGLA